MTVLSGRAYTFRISAGKVYSPSTPLPIPAYIIFLSDTRFVLAGKVYSPVMPLPIPVYMTIQLAPAVGIVGGTTEDFRKVLADIDDQMKDGIMHVEDYDGMWLYRDRGVMKL